MKVVYKVSRIFKGFYSEGKRRGFYYFSIMFFSNLFAILRAMIYKLFFSRNIKGSIFFLGQRSRIDVFCKNSRIVIEKYVFIRKNATIRLDYDCEIYIGEKVFMNDNCNINCVNKISIGSYTKIGQNVCIYDHDHNYKTEGSDRLLIGEVTIGKNVWIGSNVVILRDTRIGDNTVIAAGSVVKGEVPGNSVFLNKRTNEIFAI